MASPPPAMHQVCGLIFLVVVLCSGYVASRSPEPQEQEETETLAEASSDPSQRELIDTYVKEAAARHGVAESLVRAIIEVESQWDPRAVSRKGARGLMQLMPLTASNYGVRDPFDPRANIDGGVREVRRLMRRFDQNLPLVLAAYNAGENAVLRYRGVPPYRETKQYVARVIRKMHRNAAVARNSS
jgi:soluble lytic murein transglycosylase-like protein